MYYETPKVQMPWWNYVAARNRETLKAGIKNWNLKLESVLSLTDEQVTWFQLLVSPQKLSKCIVVV